MKSKNQTHEDRARRRIVKLVDKAGYGAKAKIARHLGVHKSMLNFLLNDESAPPSQRRQLRAKYIEGFADYFEVSALDLMK